MSNDSSFHFSHLQTQDSAAANVTENWLSVLDKPIMIKITHRYVGNIRIDKVWWPDICRREERI